MAPLAQTQIAHGGEQPMRADRFAQAAGLLIGDAPA
jgi:hypothetical protein